MNISFIPKVTLTKSFTLTRPLSLMVLITCTLIVSLVPIAANMRIGGDQATLQRLMEEDDTCDPGAILSGQTASYGCSAAVLDVIGANQKNAWMYGLLANAILFLLPFLFFSQVRAPLLALATLCALVRGVFLFVLSKELLVSFVVLVALSILLLRNSTKGWIFSAVVYGLFFRIYWILAVTIWFMLSRIRKFSFAKLTSLIFIGYLGMAVAIAVLLGKTLGSYREASNLARHASVDSAKTMIVPLLGSENPFLQAVDAFIVFLRLCIPIEAFFLSPSINTLVVTIITPICLGICIYSTTRKCKSAADVLIRNLALIPVALLVVQGIFEPDYGSFTRHFFMITPFVFAVVGLRQHSGLAKENIRHAH